MPLGTILLIVGVCLLMDAMVISAIASASRAAWRPLAEAFPPRMPAADAVVKRRQSFRLNWFNFGGCIHVAVDAGHLHLTPAAIARWFGARATSIPWDQIRIVKSGRKWIDAKVLTITLRGPAWCLSLVEPRPDVPPPGT